MRVSARSIAIWGAVGLVLANVGRIPAGVLGGRNAPIVVDDLVIVVVWLMILLSIVAGRSKLAIDRIMTVSFAFVATAFVSTVLAVPRYGLTGTEAIGVMAFLIRWFVYFGWYLFVVWCLTPDESKTAWNAITTALIAFAVIGILQSAFLPGFAQKLYGDAAAWDRQGRRLVSTIVDPNLAGIMILFPLIGEFARIAEGLKVRWGVLAILMLALALTVSRSSLLALGVGILIILAVRGLRIRLLQVLAVGAVVVLPFVTFLLSFAAGFHKLEYDASAAQRLVPWSRAIVLLREHPWLGIGFNATQPAQLSHGWALIGGADVSLDGGLLFVAAMTGVIGLFFYLVLLSRVWRTARRAWRDPSLAADDRAHAVATGTMTIVVVVHSLFVNSLLTPFVMQILWVMWGRLSHIAATRRARLSAAVLVPVALAAAGCDPCAGTSGCTTAPHVAMTGSVVDHLTGVSVVGAKVDVIFSTDGGAKVSASALTDDDGRWTIETDVPGAAPVRGSFTVQSPGRPAYHTPPIAIPRVTTRGDAVVLSPWTDIPFVRYLATISVRGAPLPYAGVNFIATGGIATPIPQNTASTDAGGTFQLDFTGADVGDIVGTLLVSSASFPQHQLTGFTIPLDYHFQIPVSRGTIRVGGILAYGGLVVNRGNGEKIGGVGVQFARTGGIPTQPTTVNTVSDSTGFFVISLDPQAEGEVIGDLTLRPPGQSPAVYHNVHFATYDSTFIRSAGLWAYGEAWAWALEIWRNDSLVKAPGVNVSFTRTGGPAITPSTFTGKTDAGARFELRASVRDTGVVIGDLTVTPASGPPRVIRGVKLRTNPDDNLHLAGVFGFGPALRYVGEVLMSDGTPVVGASVTWAQTGGISASPSTLAGTTGADGRFPLLLYPSIDGVAIGTVTVRPGAPYPAGTVFTFTNLQLPTFETGELRLAVSYRIPRP